MSDQISTHFHISEFKCHCGYCVMPTAVKVNVAHLVEGVLQLLRDILSVPIHITSGYRCLAKNMATGGVRYSQHMYGNAADITVEGMTPQEVYDKILELWPLVPGLGLYDSFVHVDIRNLKDRGGKVARW